MRRPLDKYTKITTRHGATVKGSKFGKHLGTDYALPVGGTVYAPASGTIASVTSTAAIGKQIELHSDDGLYHRFAHLSAQSVKPGQRVLMGQVLGLTGNTGSSSTGPHLHWDTRRPSAWDASFDNYIDNEAELNKPAPGPAPAVGKNWVPANAVGQDVVLSRNVSAWRVYVPGTKTVKATLNPAKNGGRYLVRGIDSLPNRVLIDSPTHGRVSLPVDDDATFVRAA